ncbi:MAG TPA: response regulator [Bryobacteraceae bacterium]|nr:response regulator [Bryobacteraceae bacterium]
MNTRVFIVEDERIVAEDIRLTLESFGYTVAGIAASRDQALAEIEQTSPDLVLMDIVLKGAGDGVETARLVRERFDIPVVFLTAHADHATLHRAKVTEPFGYILKPFEGHELYSGIEIAVYRHQVEKRIDERERWLATILTSIADGVVAADAMGVIKFVNAAAERLCGWTQDEVAGSDLAETYRMWDELGQTVEMPSLPMLLEAQGQYRAEPLSRLARKDGSSILVEHSITPISDGSRAVSGSVMVFRPRRNGTAFAGEEVNGHDLH